MNYRNPCISIDRQSGKVGIFDGPEMVRDFKPYTHEQDAIREAHDWLKDKTIHVPQVVYPMIRKLRAWS